MQVGYARVCTPDESLGRQIEPLLGAGCEHVFTDQVSVVRTDRPSLDQATQILREGDTLVVCRLDRLGHTTKFLMNWMAELARRGVHFKSLDDAIDTTSPSGRFAFHHVLARLAEMEVELAVERTRVRLAAMPRPTRRGGRQRRMTDHKILSARKLLASGWPPKDVAGNLGVSVSTLYRWLPASGRA